MTGRQLYELYRNAHGNERGQRPDSFDALTHIDRVVWVRLAAWSGCASPRKSTNTRSRRSPMPAVEQELADILAEYLAEFPAFRLKPEGSPGSDARKEQAVDIAREDRALAAIARVRR